ncbi:uncharacterized protein RSE6_13197 [Rhynchosporium secalis]|uniref:Uncharacterized protein n=1 Tax=Rhynchosporium secalis TaxID=38038 RepID=A0A1E1MSB3_RHYSE|nr:uncharacterized protein RSE6_13197 [Rhynchosporium secalis]
MERNLSEGYGEELGIELWGDVTGYQVNEALNRYAKKFDIPKLCQFNTHVEAVQGNGPGWKVITRRKNVKTDNVEEVTCNKLIVATGITSKPKPIPYDLSKFDSPSFHAVEIGQRQHELLAKEVKHVTIIGGHKSALEAVGACAQAGKKVEWLIRTEGSGPTWMALARDAEGKSLAKLTTKRFMGFVSSSIYNSDHITTVRSRKLEPAPDSFFWFVPGATNLHDRDLETIKLIDEGDLVSVTRENLVTAYGKTITLSNGDKLSTDAIVFCTGWDPTFPSLFSPSLAAELGIPVDPSHLSSKVASYWKTLDALAESNIDSLNPMLANPPSNIHIPKSAKTPYRLYRTMVPPLLAASGDISIVILGNYAGGRIQQSAEINSLWAVAYLLDLLPARTKRVLQDKERMNRDIAHVEAFRKKRYLNMFPYRLATFEAPEYEDAIMCDLGLRADRKAMRVPKGWRGWFGWKAWTQEWFGSYLAEDYRGIVWEFWET